VEEKHLLDAQEIPPWHGDCYLLGNPKSKVLMNIAASFSSVKNPRYVDQEKSR
jgi:hypothetical protein